jgi:hypothetical protein
MSSVERVFMTFQAHHAGNAYGGRRARHYREVDRVLARRAVCDAHGGRRAVQAAKSSVYI